MHVHGLCLPEPPLPPEVNQNPRPLATAGEAETSGARTMVRALVCVRGSTGILVGRDLRVECGRVILGADVHLTCDKVEGRGRPETERALLPP